MHLPFIRAQSHSWCSNTNAYQFQYIGKWAAVDRSIEWQTVPNNRFTQNLENGGILGNRVNKFFWLIFPIPRLLLRYFRLCLCLCIVYGWISIHFNFCVISFVYLVLIRLSNLLYLMCIGFSSCCSYSFKFHIRLSCTNVNCVCVKGIYATWAYNQNYRRTLKNTQHFIK